MSLNATPSADRVHIAFFGRRNAGKSSIVNAVTGQNLAIVSDVLGYFHRQRMVADRQGQGVVDRGQIAFREMNVHHRSHDLGYDSRIHLIQSPYLL